MKEYTKDINNINRDRNDLRDSQCYSKDMNKNFEFFSHTSHLYLCGNSKEDNSVLPIPNANDVIRLYTRIAKHLHVEAPSELELKFSELASKWRKEVGGYSTMIHITGNDNYLDIIGMGKEVLPYILKDLQKEADYWFVALKHIAKPENDPIRDDHYGDIELMRQDWLNWAKENNLL